MKFLESCPCIKQNSCEFVSESCAQCAVKQFINRWVCSMNIENRKHILKLNEMKWKCFPYMVNAITSTRNGKNYYIFLTYKKNTSHAVETALYFLLLLLLFSLKWNCRYDLRLKTIKILCDVDFFVLEELNSILSLSDDSSALVNKQK